MVETSMIADMVLMVVVEVEGGGGEDEVQVDLLTIGMVVAEEMRAMTLLMIHMVAVDILEGVEEKVVDPAEAIEEEGGGQGQDRDPGHDRDLDLAPGHVIDLVVMIERAAVEDLRAVVVNLIVGHEVDVIVMERTRDHRGEGSDQEVAVEATIERRNAEHPHRHQWIVGEDLPVGFILEVQAHLLTAIAVKVLASHQTMKEVQKGVGLVGEGGLAETVLDLEVGRVEQ